MRATVRLSALVFFASCIAGCSSDDDEHGTYPDVGGYYFSEVVNGADACPSGDWAAGEAFPVDVVVSQHALALTFEVKNSSTLGALVGAHTFAATLDGLQIAGSLEGDKVQTSGACTYTFRADLAVTLSLNTISGTITYTPRNACASVAGCSRVQNLTGDRAPQGTEAPN